MGLGPTINGKQQVITPRDGKAWCDVVNKQPMPKPQQPAGQSAPTGSYLWLGDYRL